MSFTRQRKRPDALPLYEDLTKRHPNEMLYWERLADCLGAEAAQLSDPAQVKAVRTRERDAAKRAVALGDNSNLCGRWPISILTNRFLPACQSGQGAACGGGEGLHGRGFPDGDGEVY